MRVITCLDFCSDPNKPYYDLLLVPCPLFGNRHRQTHTHSSSSGRRRSWSFCCFGRAVNTLRGAGANWEYGGRWGQFKRTSGHQWRAGGSGGVGRDGTRRDVAKCQYFAACGGGVRDVVPTMGKAAVLRRGPRRRGLGAAQNEETGLHSGAAAGVRRAPEPAHPHGRQHESLRCYYREKVLR